MRVPTLFRSVDDVLGPAESRFFGSGYRRVNYRRGEVTARHRQLFDGHEACVEADVGVQYPSGWSVKGDGEQLRPHFSTLDGLILAAELAEISFVTDGPGSVTPLRTAWLRSVHITAGSAAQEDGIDSMIATARRTTPAVSRKADHLQASSVDCRLGGMRVRLGIVHDELTGHSPDQDLRSTNQTLLGDPGVRYYGDGFKSHAQQLESLSVDHDGRKATGYLSVHSSQERARAGIGADYGALTPIDVFVAALQLAQVMLYDLDSIRRSDSNTLWMRRTSITAQAPPCAVGSNPTQLSTELQNCAVLPKGGAAWRTADIVAAGGGFDLTCAVTHKLPELRS